MKKYKQPYYTKIARDVTGFGLTLGVGSTVVGAVGGSTGAYMQSQIGGLATYTPAIISLGMGTGMLRQIKKIKSIKKRR